MKDWEHEEWLEHQKKRGAPRRPAPPPKKTPRHHKPDTSTPTDTNPDWIGNTNPRDDV